MSPKSNVMLRTLFAKTLWDQRFALLGWAAGITLMVLITTSFWPTVREQGEELQQFVDRMPAAMRALFDVQDFTSPEGYLKARLFSLVLPLLLLVYAIGRGADLIAGEEERGALDVLITHPLSRRRILLEKAAALAAGVAALAVAAICVLTVGVLVWDVPVALGRVAAATAWVALLALGFGMLALAIGAWRGRKSLAVAGASGIAVTSYVLQSLANVEAWLDNVWPVSPFGIYGRSDPLRGAWDPAAALVLVALPIALAALAVWSFERRDVGVG